MTTLQYYYAKDNKIELVIFNKYTFDTNGVIAVKKTGKILTSYKTKTGYNASQVVDDTGRRRGLFIGRAIASTYLGPPPTPEHTADHIGCGNNNDTLENIRWATKKEQADNRSHAEDRKDAFIIVNDGVEKTANEWLDHFKDQKNHMGRDYTKGMIAQYAMRKQHGFSYKKYPNLPNEMWKEIIGSVTNRGRWEMSNMSRVKYITNHAENVFSGERLGLMNGYPCIVVNGKQWWCHILSFATFYPDKWSNKKPGEMVLHEDDNPIDFRPQKLRLGTRSENTTDAYNNGKYDGTQRARTKCISYIDGVFEKEHGGQEDAIRYLKMVGHIKASQGTVGMALRGVRETAYGRTWKIVH